MSKKVALITGITGQDGSYLAEFLLRKGYEVHRIKRRRSLFNTDRIDHLYQDPHVENRNLILHYGDMTDSMNLTKIIQETQLDEIYNLATMSHVNHESPVRGETFVTRKITRATSKIALGLQDKLYLGNFGEKRDWGHAKDYVRMMWMILQANEPEDWVIATGTTTTVRDFVKMAFEFAGIALEFKGSGKEEKVFVKSCSNPEYKIEIGKEVVSVDPKYFRPTEVDLLLGDPTKAEEKLGWTREHDLKDLVDDMMASDLKLMTKDVYLKEGGYKTMSYYE